jgi:putative transposase
MSAHGTALTKVDPGAWSIACAREPIIRTLAALSKVTGFDIAKASDELGLSRSRIFELVARYRLEPAAP